MSFKRDKDVGRIMDTVSCLHLVASKILIQVVDEIDLFSAFTAWMRYEIDRLSADSSVPKEDELEKESSLDHSKVLLYIQTCMTTSPLEVYLGESTPDEAKNPWGQSEKGVRMFELLDKQLHKQEQGIPYIKSLPRVELLCTHLTDQAKEVFGQIANAEKRNVIFGTPQEVGSGHDKSLLDFCMISKRPSVSQAYVAFVPTGAHDLIQVTRVTYSLERGLSTIKDTSSSLLKLTGGSIRDLKLQSTGHLLILWETNENVTLHGGSVRGISNFGAIDISGASR
ncbi:hypothetical protein M7I_8034 [Glarea lozoyensis 74030]|uniref:Anaphase-promoting complex subunit 4 long domain-containing protein n=1 Tax=Glarea lozoyensis (strain ATCC 74030 / MF5533) TaxID=1104152 RepID=H0EYX3_GLAL7|nr:hypothetical protein M7I_8034 [Glarea lozoyensis 74030]